MEKWVIAGNEVNIITEVINNSNPLLRTLAKYGIVNVKS